jgi:ATP-dependent RNA helicase DDX10/DBP4
MFERKNQNILSEHYTKLIEHSDSDDNDDFITLKRADHELPDALPTSNNISKRKLKMGQSKKAMLKNHGLGQKLLFDEEGKAHEVYEMHDAEEEFKGVDVLEVGKEFAEGERGRMKELDVVDKMEAKEKRKEKKRKRKEREKGVSPSRMQSFLWL